MEYFFYSAQSFRSSFHIYSHVMPFLFVKMLSVTAVKLTWSVCVRDGQHIFYLLHLNVCLLLLYWLTLTLIPGTKAWKAMSTLPNTQHRRTSLENKHGHPSFQYATWSCKFINMRETYTTWYNSHISNTKSNICHFKYCYIYIYLVNVLLHWFHSPQTRIFVTE